MKERFSSNNQEKHQVNYDSPNESDVDGILKVESKVLLKNQSDKSENYLENNGFIVNEIDADDVREAISENGENSFFIVARNKNKEVVGYVLAYDMDYFIQKNPNWITNTGVDENLIEQNKILYGKHLVTDKNISGVGGQLDERIFNLAQEKEYTHFIAEIAQGPIDNIRSREIHASKFGMKKIAEYIDSNNYEWGIYLKNLIEK